jgi:hypothetical protein
MDSSKCILPLAFQACMYVCAWTDIDLYAYFCKPLSPVCIYVRTCIHVHICIYKNVHIYAYIHMYLFIYTSRCHIRAYTETDLNFPALFGSRHTYIHTVCTYKYAYTTHNSVKGVLLGFLPRGITSFLQHGHILSHLEYVCMYMHVNICVYVCYTQTYTHTHIYIYIYIYVYIYMHVLFVASHVFLAA